MTFTNIISKTILAAAISISLWQLPVELFNHRPSSAPSQTAAPAVLVFSKTNGYRHKSIEAGQEAFKKTGSGKTIYC